MNRHVKDAALPLQACLALAVQRLDLHAAVVSLLCAAAVADEAADKGGGDQSRLRSEASRVREYAATLALLHVGEQTQRLEGTMRMKRP
jgi:hypothetical protein